MVYVKELYFDGQVKYKRYPIYSLERFDGYGVVSSGERIGARRLCQIGAIGAYYDELGHVGYAVCHNERSARLHDFVTSVKTVIGVVDRFTHGEDTCMISEGRMYGFLDGRDGTNMLSINTPIEAFSFVDPAGTIMEVVKDGQSKLVTLYDVLLTFCRTGDLSLYRYKHIKMYNETSKVTSFVDLADTVEANRFFTKMLLEATCKA